MDSTELVFWAPTLVQALFTLLIALLAYMGRNIIKEIQENTQAIHTLRVEFFTELSNSRIATLYHLSKYIYCSAVSS